MVTVDGEGAKTLDVGAGTVDVLVSTTVLSFVTVTGLSFACVSTTVLSKVSVGTLVTTLVFVTSPRYFSQAFFPIFSISA